MTMNQMRRKLARVVWDLDEIAGELIDRGFPDDFYRIDSALTRVGTVCYGFLDEKTLERLPSIDNVPARPQPGELDNVVEMKPKKKKRAA